MACGDLRNDFLKNKPHGGACSCKTCMSWVAALDATIDEGCEDLQAKLAEFEKREYKCRGALSTAINELETAVQGKWDGAAYVKNVRDKIIRAHDDLCIER